MEKIFPLIIFLFSVVNIHAQSGYSILYEADHEIQPTSNLRKHPILRNRLIFNDSMSISYFLVNETSHVKKGEIYGTKLTGHSILYIRGTNSSYAGTFKKKIVIKDSIPIRQWVLQEDYFKDIQGYKCQSAYTVSPENDTTVIWFAKDIPLPYGPLDYIGFPGVVLEIFDQQRNRHWKAIEFEAGDFRIEMPQNVKIMSGEAFRKIFFGVMIN